jgi:Undecaprenyl-phosphate glucose phosphotransferase
VDWTLIVTLTTASGFAHDLANFGHAGNVDGYLRLGIATATLFSTSALARGIYQWPRLQQLRLQIKEITLIWASVFASLVIVSFMLGADRTPSRGAVLLFFIVGLSSISLLRWGEQRALLRLPRSSSRTNRRAIVVRQAGQLISPGIAQTIEAYGSQVCETIVLPATWTEPRFSDCMNRVIDYVRRHSVDEILLATSWTDTALIEKITEHLRVVPLPVTLIPDPGISALLERPLVELGPMHAIELQRAPLTRPQLAGKRLVDLVGTLTVLALLLPALVIVAGLIAIESPGPVFFRQRRIGFNARTFQIYKFRTMKVLDDGAVIQQAQPHDARVTRIGRVLRRFSIDELPQLLNILKGEMSLVGPRPHALAHDDEYGRLIAFYAARHKVKPGITGWAQVNGWRGATPEVQMMMRRVEHDLWYINHWSLWLDIKILMLTPLRICAAHNAY